MSKLSDYDQEDTKMSPVNKKQAPITKGKTPQPNKAWHGFSKPKK